MSWRWRSHTPLLCKSWQRNSCVNIPYLAPISSFSFAISHVSSGVYFMICNRICCFKLFQLFLNCFPVWCWIIRKQAPEFGALVAATVFTACHTQICITTGDESKEHRTASRMCSVGIGRRVDLCVEHTRLGGKLAGAWACVYSTPDLAGNDWSVGSVITMAVKYECSLHFHRYYHFETEGSKRCLISSEDSNR